eukprot:TRINITY_DN3721_c0_g1_i1.p2 TRINITY_DN3721_c0_g1~~TRINITY_DN3721_c0_g1_i1.p2  ORF type:complete len:197 (-),score=51.34 TRINITY_DN3721_c0_g1_i1:66-656(-)
MATFDPAHRVVAVVILDTEGSRVFSKYYDPFIAAASGGTAPTTPSTFPFNTLQKQLAFEKQLHTKRPRSDARSGDRTAAGYGDVVVIDRHLALWIEQADVVMYVVGAIDDNEVVLGNVLTCLQETLNGLLKDTATKRDLLESFELVAITVDEMIDDGLILDVATFDLVPHIQKNFPFERDGPSLVRNVEKFLKRTL